MNEKLIKYVNGVFASYEDLHAVRELKEELLNDLQQKFSDYKDQGHDDETAYHMTIDSIGDISETIESIAAKAREQLLMERKDFSAIDLQDADLKGVMVHDGQFNSSALKGADFSGSDLTNSSFKSSDLRDVIFDGADLTGAKFIMSDLRNASFVSCALNKTEFELSDLSGACFDNQVLIGTIFNKSSLTGTSFKNAVFRNVYFKNTDVKKAIFDGATMDKLTYAVLKGHKADLNNVTVI